jgi:hypothetical protein
LLTANIFNPLKIIDLGFKPCLSPSVVLHQKSNPRQKSSVIGISIPFEKVSKLYACSCAYFYKKIAMDC